MPFLLSIKHRRGHKALRVTASVCLLVASLQVAAQGEPASRNTSLLNGGALSGIQGVVTTNLAAGDGNLQSNHGTLAIGDGATTSNTLLQQAHLTEDLTPRQDSTSIQDRAFRQSQGWLSINQAAGLGNVQSNTFGVALGISASHLNDTTLQQVLADKQRLNGGHDGSDSLPRRLEIDESSFEGARGVIQVNQSAGTGNATRNSFSMSMQLAR
ncbi:hypothetical protein [Halomonas cerina]|uniref:Uncharacterized protein n=1 Tax=Halomonas cerina TaxID=447424 RepID=A0A839V488_9GAMM|nr:hypothetical protein [Halomonas cerina]MBB3188830.1 hypothetical protein [Halomonas cerina]